MADKFERLSEKWAHACYELDSIWIRCNKDVTSIKRKVKNFVKQTKKKLRRNEIGGYLMESTVEDIDACIQYLKKLPQCKKLTKLQLKLKKLRKLLRRKIAFLKDENDSCHEDYDSDNNDDYASDNNDDYASDNNDDYGDNDEDEYFGNDNYDNDDRYQYSEEEDHDDYNEGILDVCERFFIQSARRNFLNDFPYRRSRLEYLCRVVDELEKKLPEEDEREDLQDNYDDEIKEHLEIQYKRVYDEVCEKQVKDDYGAPDAPVIDTYGSPADSMIAVTEVCSTEYQSECQTVREEHNVEDSVMESKEEIESKCENVTSGHTSSQKCDVQKKKVKNTLLNKVVEINYQVLKTEDSFDLREGVLSVQEKHACQHGHRVQCGEGVVDQQDHHRCQRVWDPGIRYFCMKY